MKRLSVILISCTMIFSACTDAPKCDNENPFFCKWETPFEVPPFEEITLEHYLPAFEEGITHYRNELKQFYGQERRFTDAPFWRRRQNELRKVS